MIGDYELIILYDLYDERVDNEGQPEYRLRKKNCKRKWYVSDIFSITDVREIPSKKGIPYKNKCEVFHRFENRWITVEGSYDKIINDLKTTERNKVTGFKK